LWFSGMLSDSVFGIFTHIISNSRKIIIVMF
jgi:hypothetical protein